MHNIWDYLTLDYSIKFIVENAKKPMKNLFVIIVFVIQIRIFFIFIAYILKIENVYQNYESFIFYYEKTTIHSSKLFIIAFLVLPIHSITSVQYITCTVYNCFPHFILDTVHSLGYLQNFLCNFKNSIFSIFPWYSFHEPFKISSKRIMICNKFFGKKHIFMFLIKFQTIRILFFVTNIVVCK